MEAATTRTRKGASPFGETDALEIFPPTAQGILDWVRSTDPKPERSAVVDHARTLIDSGQMSERGRQRLVRAGYTELDD